METIHQVLETLAEVVDLIGVAIVLLGAVKFVATYASIEARRLARHECAAQIEAARSALGGYILVALEFMIVSDVITSVVSRTLSSLAWLAAIVALRTAMSFFLTRELSAHEPESAPAGA